MDTGTHTTCAHSYVHTYIHTGMHTMCAHTCVQALTHTLVFTLEGSGGSLLVVVRVLVATPQSICCILNLGGPSIRGILFLVMRGLQ